MKTGLSQHLGQRQELRINPRLYQAMDMLYMPMMDLQQHLKQELLVNPFLELLEPEEEEQDGADREKDKEQEKEAAAKEVYRTAARRSLRCRPAWPGGRTLRTSSYPADASTLPG